MLVLVYIKYQILEKLIKKNMVKILGPYGNVEQ